MRARAWKPFSLACASMSLTRLLSFQTYSWKSFGWCAGTAGATSAGAAVPMVLRLYMAPAADAARATPTSPSAWNIFDPAVGETKKGILTSRPITLVDMSKGGERPARIL